MGGSGNYIRVHKPIGGIGGNYADAGSGGGPPITINTRDYASHTLDSEGRINRVDFDDGTYRTLTYTTATSSVVDIRTEYDATDTITGTYQALYDINSRLSGWLTL